MIALGASDAIHCARGRQTSHAAASTPAASALTGRQDAARWPSEAITWAIP
jgi:hypothetical protein